MPSNHTEETAAPESGISHPAYCSIKPAPEPQFESDLSAGHLEAIITLRTKWVNGTTLHYYFFDRESDGRFRTMSDGSRRFMPWTTNKAEKDVVRAAFAKWKGLGIGLNFVEVDDRHDAEVRIGFERWDGYWSYLGREILEFGPNERTMNFGQNLAEVADGPDTALHEIGHTLGLPHEHQSPFAGIDWDEEAVYDALAGRPNFWSREKTYHNIIRKISPDEVQGSNWDRNSIMHYSFEEGLIDKPEELRNGLHPDPGLSQRDKTWIQSFYPPLEEEEAELKLFEPARLTIAQGEQVNLVIRPAASRSYTVQTFGNLDTVMVLFEEVDGEPVYLTADDDSAQDRNARITTRLLKGRTYVLRVRLYYRSAGGDCAVMLW